MKVQLKCASLYLVSRKNDPVVNKEGLSGSDHHMFGGGPVCMYQPGAQEIVPVFNNHFSVVYWPGIVQTTVLRFL
jgi:hypothetical protein